MNVYLTNFACAACLTILVRDERKSDSLVYYCPLYACQQFGKLVKAPLYPVEPVTE